jgi:hypothetical protein
MEDGRSLAADLLQRQGLLLADLCGGDLAGMEKTAAFLGGRLDRAIPDAGGLLLGEQVDRTGGGAWGDGLSSDEFHGVPPGCRSVRGIAPARTAYGGTEMEKYEKMRGTYGLYLYYITSRTVRQWEMENMSKSLEMCQTDSGRRVRLREKKLEKCRKNIMIEKILQ